MAGHADQAAADACPFLCWRRRQFAGASVIEGTACCIIQCLCLLKCLLRPPWVFFGIIGILWKGVFRSFWGLKYPDWVWPEVIIITTFPTAVI